MPHDRFSARFFNHDLALRLRGGGDVGQMFTRASTATIVTRDGRIATVAADTPRTVWLDLDGDGVRETAATLIEIGSGNLVDWSDALSNWSRNASPTITDGAVAIGDLQLALVEDTDAGSAEFVHHAITFAGADGDRGYSFFIKEGPNANAEAVIKLRDSTAGLDRFTTRVDWSGGAPVLTVTNGSVIGEPERFSDGVWRIRALAAGVVVANTHRVEVAPAGYTPADTGDLYVGGVQVEDLPIVTSLIRTAGQTESRGDETLSVALPPPIARPARALIYAKIWKPFADSGGLGGTFVPRIWQLSPDNGGHNPRLYNGFSGSNIQLTHTDPDGVATVASVGAASDPDETIETIADLQADLSGRQIASVAGGAAQSAGLAAGAFGDSWPTDARLFIGSAGDSGGRSAIYLLDLKIATTDVPSGTAAEVLTATRSRT